MGMDIMLVVGVTFVIAGFVKGVVGLGLPTIAMGLLSLVLLPAEAAAMLIVPSFVTNVWQLWAGPDVRGLVRRLWPMLTLLCVGIALGAGWLVRGDAGPARIALGVALVLYAALSLAKPDLHVPKAAERWAGPVVGLSTGLVTAATGVFVLPAVPYLNALKLDREELVQALGLSFLVATIALGLSLAGSSAFTLAQAWQSGLALIPALAGMAVGTALRRRLPAEVFRRWFLVGLLLLGLYLALR